MKSSIPASLSPLKAELQQEGKQDALERLAAALTGRMLGVTVFVAQRGFQHGGDAGPAGRQERRLRIECKKYAETSPLSRRELLGEIDHALACDEALEAWILVATRPVPEQVAQDVIQHGEKSGVPVLVWDWSDHEIGSLAALCASDPDLVETLFSKEAGRHARDLAPFAAQPVAALRRELHSWCLGFAALRQRSHEKLQEIWRSPRASNAALLQDVAGGARPKKIRRSLVHDALSKWWIAQANTAAPAAVVGFEGVGKTWALLDWVVESLDQQPIVLVVPSSAAAALGGASETIARQFLSNRLHEVTGVRDSSHWARRLNRLLRRPADEGPALTVCLDGLNQEPAVPWVEFLKVLQGDPFALRVRLIVTTRTSHFDEKLSQLRSLTDRAIRVAVEPYSLGSGGELEQMLALEGLRPEDLQRELIDLACRPRLFALVMRFGDRLVSAGQVNVHRLLWEYGRDTLGERAGSSFSESDWLEWLKQIAEKHREGIREFSRKSLGEMAASADLSPREVYARLSDIIDGRLASQNSSGALEFAPTIVAHALGAALVARLSSLTAAEFATLESALVSWLDPISGLDQRAEVLRAAVSIVVEQGAADSDLASVLVSAWLQTQNISEIHRSEIAILAPTLTRALLDAIEKSAGSARESARHWAVKSLRQTPRTSDATRSKVIDRVRRWLSVVSLDVDVRPEAGEIQKRRTELLQLRIGTAAAGPVTILGVDIKLVEQNRDSLHGVVASLVDGYPMIATLPVLEMAAVALAVWGRSEAWSELQWLCYFNEFDPRESSLAIRDLAKSILHRPRETGVHPELPRRIAGSLLRLTGNASDEDDAASLSTSFDRGWNYEDDYLKNPARSAFILERRHATQVLEEPVIPLHVRIQRTADLWLDPTFTPPPSLTAEVESIAAQLDVEKLDRSRGPTMEDHRFEELEPVLARCAPGLLAEIVRRKLRGMTSATGDAQFCSSLGARSHLLLAGEQEVAAVRALRLQIAATSEDDQNYAVSVLLMLEIKDLGAYAQFVALIDAGLKFILRDFLLMLRQPHPDEVDELVSRYSSGSSIQTKNLLALLSVHAVKFQDAAWGWVEGYTKSPDSDLRGLAFKTLGSADAARFGSALNAEGWSWHSDAHLWVNHYGTLALIEATRGQPFDQILPRLAPWRLLEAARLRGEDPAEVRLAAEVFGRVLNADKLEELDPGSDISITRKDAKVHPFLFSVAPRENAQGADLAIAFKAMFDVEAQVKAHQRATETAIARIDEARARGANLLMVEMDSEDMVLVINHAPDLIDRWIDGHVGPTDDFRRRVRLAESAFLSLSEVLLAHDPSRGVQLWRALRKTVATRYLGAAKVDDLIHMVFRVPQSEPVQALQRDLLSLERTSNDAALFDLALAASYNEKTSWLDAAISDDLASQLTWKQRRGTVLLGFSTCNTLPVEGAWPAGEIKTSHAELKRKSARLRAVEACAQHWWRTYLAADSDSDAYAAWVLFLRTADRRSSVWMRNHIPTDVDELMKLKIVHAEINYSEIERHSKKRADKFQGQFLGHKTAEGIGPWA